MNDFVIRDTGAAAQAWATQLTRTEASWGEWWNKATITAQDMTQNQAAFKGFFDANVAALGKFVPLKDVAAFQQSAATKFAAILAETFTPAGNGNVVKNEAHKAMQAANTKAREEIGNLASQYMRSSAEWERQVDSATYAIPFEERSRTDFATAKKDLSHYLDVKLDRTVPPDQQQAFRAAATTLQQRLHTMLDQAEVRTTETAEAAREAAKSEDSSRLPDNEYYDAFHAGYSEAVRLVHIEAQKAIMDLVRQYATPDIRPQVRVDGQNVSMVRRAPTLENLVLAGGGAKGVGNPPALTELAATGMIAGLKQVVGTSAGALTASALAAGMDTAAFQQLMDATPMTSLKADVPDFATIYPGLTMVDQTGSTMDRMAIRAASFSGVDNSAQATVKLLDEQTTKPVRAWVTTHTAAIQAAVPGKITQEQAQALIAKFAAEPDFTADRTGRMLTFGDLKLLHTLEPAKFKELTLTGWNKTAGAQTYFNATNNPNMPVAFAGRISMSIPIYFQTAVYQGNQYMDGGVGSNMPSEVVLAGKQGAALEEAQARTMLMAFDDSGKSFATQFTSGRLDLAPPAREEDMAHGIMQRTTGADFAGTGVADKVKTYNSGPNVHVVFHGKVGTFDLNASEARQAFAKQTASVRTLDQIQARQNQAYQMTVANDPAAILGVLSEDERRAIANGGAPTQAQYPRAQDLAVARRLYDSCALEFLPD